MSNRELNTATDYDIEFFHEQLAEILPPYSVEFASIEYGRGYDAYLKRVNDIGLDNCGRVLDAGGGIAQWAMALAATNESVDVIDISGERLLTGKLMTERLGIGNLRFYYDSIENLSAESGQFDAILCYSVIMFTDIKKSLSEFNRVLKRGGRLYVMTDLWRWHLGPTDAGARTVKYYLRLFLKQLLFKTPHLLSHSVFNKLVSDAGFDIVSSGQEGEASFHSGVNNGIHQFFPSRPVGREQLWEVCAIKT